MKRFVAFLLTAVFVFTVAFTGCSGGQEGETDKVTQTEQSGTSGQNLKLRISWWGTQLRNDGTLKVLDMYSQLNPNVKFEPEYSSFADYWDKLASQAAANNLPDILQHDYMYISQYVNRNLLLPLDDYASKGVLNLSDVDEATNESGRVGGKLYGVNLAINSRAMMYDPALFEKAGVAPPDENWTWQDFADKCLAIKNKLGIYGAGSMPGELYEGFAYYLRQNGVSFYTPDGKALGYDDDKYFIDFFKMDLDLTKAGALPLPSVRMEVKGVEDDLLVSGKSAMSGYVKHSSSIEEITKFAKRPLGLAVYPKGKNEVRSGLFVKAAHYFTVAGGTKYPEEAVKFISYFINDVEANKVLAAERGVPSSSKVREALMPLMSDANKLQFEFMEMVTKNSSPIDAPEPGGHTEVLSSLKNIEQELLYERITVEEAAKRFREEAAAILKKG